jgi:glycosyltransferase involved in cell wall biosynthesis
MKLLIISTMSGFTWGGSEELWYATLEQALTDGHEVELIVMKTEAVHARIAALQSKMLVIRIPERTIVFHALWKRILFKLIGRELPLTQVDRFAFLNRNCYDVIMVSQGSAEDVCHIPDLAHFLQQTSIPYVLVNHLVSDDMFWNDSQRMLLKEIFEKARLLCFVSEQNIYEFERKILLSMPNAVVVKNPVNLQQIEIQDWPKLDIAAMAVVARLDAYHKGLDLLLDVLNQPQWRERRYKLNLYGTGPDSQYLKELVNYYNLDNKVEFMGHSGDIKSLWKQNQLLLLTSRKEGLPLAVVEAMLCGRAVVATNVGDSAVLIEEGKNGWIAESPTIHHISIALEKAWEASDNWQQAGIDAHERAIAFVDESPGQKLLNLLKAQTN